MRLLTWVVFGLRIQIRVNERLEKEERRKFIRLEESEERSLITPYNLLGYGIVDHDYGKVKKKIPNQKND